MMGIHNYLVVHRLALLVEHSHFRQHRRHERGMYFPGGGSRP